MTTYDEALENRRRARSEALHRANGRPWPCSTCYPEQAAFLAALDRVDAALDRCEDAVAGVAR